MGTPSSVQSFGYSWCLSLRKSNKITLYMTSERVETEVSWTMKDVNKSQWEKSRYKDRSAGSSARTAPEEHICPQVPRGKVAAAQCNWCRGLSITFPTWGHDSAESSECNLWSLDWTCPNENMPWQQWPMALGVQQDMFASITLMNCNYALGMGAVESRSLFQRGSQKT